MTGEVGDEGAWEKQCKKKENSRRQNCWVELFRGVLRVSVQTPRTVEAEADIGERDCGDEEDPADDGHLVHDGFLKVADVVVVAQPAFIDRVPSLDGLDGIPVLLYGVEAELKEDGDEDERVHPSIWKKVGSEL